MGSDVGFGVSTCSMGILVLSQALLQWITSGPQVMIAMEPAHRGYNS